MATIRITDLRLKTIIGINDWERHVKQEVNINIIMELDVSKAAQSDDIKDTIDYKALKKKIMGFVKSSRFNLLERLAAEVLNIVMKDRRIKFACVKIDKPLALRFARSVSVEVSRKRHGKLL